MARQTFSNPFKALANMLSLGKGGGLSVFKTGLESIFRSKNIISRGPRNRVPTKPLPKVPSRGQSLTANKPGSRGNPIGKLKHPKPARPTKQGRPKGSPPGRQVTFLL